MAIDLPENLVRYLEAQNAHDVDRMADAFASDAEVKDEGRTYRGREAIRAWKRETSAKYAVKIEALSATRNAGVLAIVAQVSGNFPGSPANLTYDFGLDDAGLIRRLEIH